MPIPDRLRLNAYTGTPDPGSALHAQALRWIGRAIPVPPKPLPVPSPLAAVVDPARWADPAVGWGLVLPDNPTLLPAERATAVDAPEPVQRLLAHRQGVVLRWAADRPLRMLLRYYADASANEPDVALSERGVGPGRVPRYLMVYGSPDRVPWEVQYRLNAVAFTGRLDLEGRALENYVEAVVSGWAGSAAVPQNSLVWAVDHGGADITHLMRRVVARKLALALQANPQIGAGACFLDGAVAPATGAALVANLAARRPALVVTSSHGMTGPLGDVAVMRSQLGVPVDQEHRLLDVEDLLARWSPDGAVWYAHACCSAGGDARTSFEGLVAAGSYAEQVVKGVTACGALVSPLPSALLGAARPLRAFVGHVEPTFDWSLRSPRTGQVLTGPLVEAIHPRLYSRMPLGYAFEQFHGRAAQLELIHRQAREAYSRGEDTLEEALACRLVAQDVQSLVILGDPAEAMY